MNLMMLLMVICLMDDRSLVRGMDKLIYQKDVSEHCRRRVFPSIFLGRQVVSANSQILQFSRLELPYSCFISIRTESGSNMVMMIQLASDDLKRSCSRNTEQLLVYEIGETFGGYWGPLPDSMLKKTSAESSFYTIKTHAATTTTTHKPSPESTEEESEETDSNNNKTYIALQMEVPSSTEPVHSPRDYVEVEIPIVNVTIQMMAGRMQPTKPADQEMAFDLENDVTPVVGEKYETKIMPLVQFSIREEHAQRGGDDDAPKYELDIVGEYTPDMRLTLPKLSSTKRRKQYNKRRYQATKRLNFKKHKNLLDFDKNFNRHLISRTFTRYEFPTKIPLAHTKPTHPKNESWHFIEDLIKNLNQTDENVKEHNATLLNTNILGNIEDYNRNLSVYLIPKWSQYRDREENIKNVIHTKKYALTSYNTPKIKNYNIAKRFSITPNIEDTTKIYSMTSKKNIVTTTSSNNIQDDNKEDRASVVSSEGHTEKSIDTIKTNEYNLLTAVNTGVLDISQQPTEETATSDVKNNKTLSTGALVGHESWENLVQAAPEMAIKLNRTVAHDTDNTSVTTELVNETRHEDKLLKRKKRDIHSIYIDNAKPHNMTTKTDRGSSTTKSDFDVADMQEFAQLVELQDYELHGRVALRYLRQYVGPALYNLCDLAESTQQHVHLFNSSRIILAISNFTLDRMIIILTSARTMLSGEMRCPATHLECQVSGARVCLDSMVACDGVPNCGSYDIYDEDRLLCGASKGLQHNVYLAAFTFLAVLLTVLYAVHYWLKRCVPKVADAFFVYTNGVENVLYLDSIMRSPNDTDDLSKMVYQNNIFGYDNDNIYDDMEIAPEPSACRRFLRKCCFCLRKKEETKYKEEQHEAFESFTHLQQRRLHSFTYPDLYNTFSACDTSVQTGSSLEMKNVQKTKQNKQSLQVEKRNETPSSPPILIQDSILTLDEPLPEEPSDELSLTKFFRAARKSDSLASVTNLAKFDKPVARDRNKPEIELKTFTYDNLADSEPGPSRVRPKPAKKTLEGGAHKHLRFNDVTTTIPVESDDIDQKGSKDNMDQRRSVQLSDNKGRRPPPQHLDTIEEDDEQNTGPKESSNTRHFWTTSRGDRGELTQF